MKVGNIKPPRGFLSKLGERSDNNSFHDCNVEWPDSVVSLIGELELVELNGDEFQLVGGRMSRHVQQHIDKIKADYSLVWFPKVNGLIRFVYGSDCHDKQIFSGDVYLFDHKQPHSVSADWAWGKKTTGTWYFMTQCFDKE